MTRSDVGGSLRLRVMLRARHRCEYCRLPQAHVDVSFHTDHVVARKHGGLGTLANLAFCCASCNLRKGTDLSAIDPATGRVVRLYNPRSEQWAHHFRWAGPVLVGRTARGRGTVNLLRPNSPDLTALRETLMNAGLF